MVAAESAPAAPRINDQPARVGELDESVVGVQLRRQGRHRLPVGDQFEGQKQAASATVADERVALHQPGEAALQLAAHERRVPDQAAVLDLLDHGEPGGARQRVAGVGEAVDEAAHVEHRLDQTPVRDHGAERGITGGEALGNGQDVRGNVPVLGAPEGAGPAAAGHHLVVNQQHAVTVADLADARHVAFRRHQGAGGSAADRLEHEGEDRLRPFLEDPRLEHVGIVMAGRPVIRVETVEIGPRRRNLGHLADHSVEGHGQRVIARQRQCPEGRAVIAGVPRDHLPALRLADRERVLPGELDGTLHRFRAAGDEEHPVQSRRAEARGLRGQPLGRLGLEMQAVAEGRLLHLPAHRLEHAFVGVADIADHRAGGAVEVALAVDVPHVDAARLIQHRAAAAGLVEEMALLLVGARHARSAGSAAQSRGRRQTEAASPTARGCPSIMLMAWSCRSPTRTKYRTTWPW